MEEYCIGQLTEVGGDSLCGLITKIFKENIFEHFHTIQILVFQIDCQSMEMMPNNLDQKFQWYYYENLYFD